MLLTSVVSRHWVTPAKTQTFDSLRISENADPRLDNGGQEMSWALFITSREAIFKVVMLSRTFESPMTVNKREMDIFPDWNLTETSFERSPCSEKRK